MNLIKQRSDNRLLSGCHFIVSILIILLAASCTQKNGIEVKPPETIPSGTAESFILAQPTLTAQSVTPTAITNAINPLTGLAVEDSSLLNLLAMLVSISTFPVDARCLNRSP